MALWSRKPPAQNNSTAPDAAQPVPPPASPAPVAPPVAPPARAQAAASASASANATAAAPAEAAALSPEEMNRRRALSKHISATFGEIVSMLMKQPGSKGRPLNDLEWMVVPPLLANQFSLAEAQSKAQGFTAPIALVLWARVSAEVDRRLASSLDKPIQLAPAEWTSGDTLWLVEALGEPRALQAMLQRLAKTKWEGRVVKFRNRDKDGRVVVSTLSAAPAAT